jgi:hypothetical protein
LQKEKWVNEKKERERGKINAQRSIEKMWAPIKEHRKKYI